MVTFPMSFVLTYRALRSGGTARLMRTRSVSKTIFQYRFGKVEDQTLLSGGWDAPAVGCEK